MHRHSPPSTLAQALNVAWPPWLATQGARHAVHIICSLWIARDGHTVRARCASADWRGGRSNRGAFVTPTLAQTIDVARPPRLSTMSTWRAKLVVCSLIVARYGYTRAARIAGSIACQGRRCPGQERRRGSRCRRRHQWHRSAGGRVHHIAVTIASHADGSLASHSARPWPSWMPWSPKSSSNAGRDKSKCMPSDRAPHESITVTQTEWPPVFRKQAHVPHDGVFHVAPALAAT